MKQFEYVVFFTDTGEQRLVIGHCGNCKRMWLGDREESYGPVSVYGIAHMGAEGGMTACGLDATGPAWWWPE